MEECKIHQVLGTCTTLGKARTQVPTLSPRYGTVPRHNVPISNNNKYRVRSTYTYGYRFSAIKLL
jgi:hypothetical protein